jgi:hypothetical protein
MHPVTMDYWHQLTQVEVSYLIQWLSALEDPPTTTLEHLLLALERHPTCTQIPASSTSVAELLKPTSTGMPAPSTSAVELLKPASTQMPASSTSAAELPKPVKSKPARGDDQPSNLGEAMEVDFPDCENPYLTTLHTED